MLFKYLRIDMYGTNLMNFLKFRVRTRKNKFKMFCNSY